MFSLPSRCYDIHSIAYGSVCMTRVQYVTWISRVTVVASNIMDMFFISDVKYSSRLHDVFQWTIWAFHLVTATSAMYLSLCASIYRVTINDSFVFKPLYIKNEWIIYSNPVFCIVFCVRKVIFTRVSWKSFIILRTSLPLYVKVTHFVFWCWGSVCLFCFCGGGGFLIRLVLYSLLCSMNLMVFVSVSFAFSVIGYVCSRFNR
jgi:hypothetical protein